MGVGGGSRRRGGRPNCGWYVKLNKKVNEIKFKKYKIDSRNNVDKIELMYFHRNFN